MKKQLRFAVLSTLCATMATLAFGVVDADRPDYGFIKEVSDIRPSIQLPLSDHIENVSNTATNLKARAKRASADDRIEALSVKIPANSKELVHFVKKNAKAQKVSALYDYLSDKLVNTKTPVANDGTKKVLIDGKGYDLFDPQALISAFDRPHHNVEILSAELKDEPENLAKLREQTAGFLSASQRRQISTKLKSGENISVEKDLLPSFARRMVRNFLAYKGPNCFHAALAFHGEKLTQSQFINVKQEEGYHSAMINYDELWRAIQSYFYEVNVTATPLKYGDMIVFFDLPRSDDEYSSVSYRWIRHATTYLVGNYTFSKGSKSPDTPYTVKTLEEEWKTWQGYTKNLGVKVFRRSSKSATKVPPVDLVDWVY